MQKDNSYIYEHWRKLLGISKDYFKKFESQFVEINLKTGDYFYNFRDTPPGIVLINQGALRLISKDDKNQSISITKYEKDQIANSIPLLLDIRDTALIASSDVNALLLSRDIFFDLYLNYKNFRNFFRKIAKEEYYFLAISNKDPRLLDTNKLLDWSQKQSERGAEVLFVDNKNNNLPDSNTGWIIGSKNLKNFNYGSLIHSNSSISLEGNIPARLIPKPQDWPPINNETNLNSSENNEKTNTLKNKINSPNKSEVEKIKSLEDLYGRIDSEKSFPYERGNNLVEQALACLRMISIYFDIPFRRDFIKKILQDQFNRSEGKGFNLFNLAAIIDLLGLKPTLIKPETIENLERLPSPSIFFLKSKPVVCWLIKNQTLVISDPASQNKLLSFEELTDKNDLKELNFLFFEKTKMTPKSRFGLGWFLPYLKRYKTSLLQVVIASFFVQLLALFNPLLIQQIIDAVINQGSLRSLNVLGFLLIAMSIAQAVLSSLRTFLFSDTTNKIDSSLGSSIVNHLFRLPLRYFSKRSIGDVSSRVGELEKIRNFLTGTALTILLDAIFSLLYIAVMLMYSVKLTIWALSVIPLFIFLTLIISPIIKDQLRAQAEASAKVNSHLVETISGIETVKAQGMEMISEWKWEKLYSRQIKSGFRNTLTSTTASSISNFLQQLSGLIVIWVGASMVLKGQLSLGQLIAFRIISGYVTNPILRISSIWQNFQEISVSLSRLSDVVNNPEEIEITGKGLSPLPPVKGKVSYQGINFSFNNNNQLQLKNINFEIDAGNFVGIVGKSGSGKSTILKILMRFYEQNEGKIKIDNFDISKVDLYSLRNQIGIVPQDCLLFDGTIFSNISIAKPNATLEEVVEASKLAMAHEFIENLPSSYSNVVNEKGTELSGGQRQRIAIARMILNNPSLIILDEATSALDVETEKQVVKNLLKKFKNKTIFFISHRIHNLINADKILVMNNGFLVEKGNHSELIKLNGTYATLYKNQGIDI